MDETLSRYEKALQEGDFETMAQIHAQAETDPALEAALEAAEQRRHLEAGLLLGAAPVTAQS